MNFVDYQTNLFANLANTPQTILSTTSNVLVVNNIIVCNRTGQSLRFNLKKLRTQDTPVEIFHLNELEITPYKTIDAIEELGLNIFLTFQETPSISDSLVCFSNGKSQQFDCEVNYTALKELPSQYSMV